MSHPDPTCRLGARIAAQHSLGPRDFSIGAVVHTGPRVKSARARGARAPGSSPVQVLDVDPINGLLGSTRRSQIIPTIQEEPRRRTEAALEILDDDETLLAVDPEIGGSLGLHGYEGAVLRFGRAPARRVEPVRVGIGTIVLRPFFPSAELLEIRFDRLDHTRRDDLRRRHV